MIPGVLAREAPRRLASWPLKLTRVRWYTEEGSTRSRPAGSQGGPSCV